MLHCQILTKKRTCTFTLTYVPTYIHTHTQYELTQTDTNLYEYITKVLTYTLTYAHKPIQVQCRRHAYTDTHINTNKQTYVPTFTHIFPRVRDWQCCVIPQKQWLYVLHIYLPRLHTLAFLCVCVYVRRSVTGYAQYDICTLLLCLVNVMVIIYAFWVWIIFFRTKYGENNCLS